MTVIELIEAIEAAMLLETDEGKYDAYDRLYGDDWDRRW
jgi:hypothetical protein